MKMQKKFQMAGAVFFFVIFVIVTLTGFAGGAETSRPGTGADGLTDTPASTYKGTGYTPIPDDLITNTGLVIVTPIETQAPDKQYYCIPLDKATQDYIFILSEEYGVPDKLIIALIFKESSYRPTATGAAGEQGYMQIHPINFDRLEKELGITDFYDPEQNILAGTYMLSELFQKYNTVDEVLMCYNCGEAGAKRLWKQGITETEYTRKIADIMQGLKAE